VSGPTAHSSYRPVLVLGVAAAGIALAALAPRIPQDPTYHAFADHRRILGVPHALNVLSNAGFLLAGAWAFRRDRKSVV